MYLLLTFPSGWNFSTFLGDTGDGMQNLWSIWWVKYALLHLHTSPLASKYIYFPTGASMLAYTISLTNTVPSAILAIGIGPVLAYNSWLVLGFVFGGVSAAYLFLEVGSGWRGALVAGCVYTFSEYHFAHAQGHYQLIGMQWIPLFLWAWLRLLDKPGAGRAAMAAAAFLLVFFADYYYATYVVVAGAIAVVFRWREWRRLTFPLGMFTLLVLVAVGPLVLETVRFLQTDLTGTHEASEYGADLLAPFVPGTEWRFGALTKPIWGRFTAPAVEGCGYLGWAALVLGGVGFLRNRGWKEWFFLVLGGLFQLLSFGPLMRLGGTLVKGIWGAYHHFERVFPLIGLGGVPGRMGVIAVLCVAILAGLGAETLLRERRKVLLGVLLAGGFIEILPRASTKTDLPPVEIFRKMRDLPQGYGVLDVSPNLGRPWKRFFQMAHETPTYSGLNARFSKTVVAAEEAIEARAGRGEWEGLCGQGFRYVVLRETDAVVGSLAGKSPVLRGDGYLVFDLGDCRR